MKTIQIEVPENVHAFAEGLKTFIGAVDVALKDGWQPGIDLPVILTSAFASLVPTLQNLKGAADEVKAYPYESAKALELAVTDIVKEIVK